MDINKLFNKLNKNSILVVNKEAKSSIIKDKTTYELQNKILLQFKVISMDDFLTLLTFNIDDEIILNSLQNLKLPISIIYEMLSFVKYDYSKHEELNNFYNENQKFILKNQYFLNSLTNKEVVFLEEPIYLESILKSLNINYEVLNDEFNQFPTIKKFSSKEHEILYLFESILNDLNEGVKVSDIYIANASSEDIKQIKRFSHAYKIPVKFESTSSLFDFKLTKELLKLSKSSLLGLLNDKNLLIETYKPYYLADEMTFEEIISSIVAIFNKYPNTYEDIYFNKVLIYELKNKKLKNSKYIDGIQLINIDKIPYIDSKNIYIINAVYEQFPSIYKDNAYLSDIEKEKIGYPTSKNLNIFMNEKLTKLIKHPNIKYISYALKDKYLTYAPSDILNPYLPSDFSDLKVDELTFNQGINIFKNIYKNKVNGKKLITFNPDFSLDKNEHDQLSSYLRQKMMKLSPTAISNYIKSPFIFYLKHILALSNYEIDVNSKIGNFFHLLVEVMYKIKFNPILNEKEKSDDLIEDYIAHNNKVQLDLDKLFEDIKSFYFKEELEIINHLKSNPSYISLDKKLAIETMFFVEKNKKLIIDSLIHLQTFEENEPSTELYVEKEVNYLNYTGRIDLMKVHQDQTYFSVIDFKSSAREAFSKEKLFELLTALDEDFESKIQIGQLSLLQLIIYAYLILMTQPKYKFRDAAYFSFLTGDLKFNSIQTKDLNKELYTSTKSRLITEEELEALFFKLESVLGEVSLRIKALDFKNTVRQSIDYKKNLKTEDFSSYQAIAFFSKYTMEVEDEENEDD